MCTIDGARITRTCARMTRQLRVEGARECVGAKVKPRAAGNSTNGRTDGGVYAMQTRRVGELMYLPMVRRSIESCAGQACAHAAGKLREHAQECVTAGVKR